MRDQGTAARSTALDDFIDEPYSAAFYRLRAVGITPVNALVLAAASYDVLPASEAFGAAA